MTPEPQLTVPRAIVGTLALVVAIGGTLVAIGAVSHVIVGLVEGGWSLIP